MRIDKPTKKEEIIQHNVSKIDKLQRRFGGYLPEYINMYFAERLERLTFVLIILTAVLSVLTIVQIILLIRSM